MEKTISWTFLSSSIAVDTFFVLSGLLVTYSIFNRSKNGILLIQFRYLNYNDVLTSVQTILKPHTNIYHINDMYMYK